MQAVNGMYLCECPYCGKHIWVYQQTDYATHGVCPKCYQSIIIKQVNQQYAIHEDHWHLERWRKLQWYFVMVENRMAANRRTREWNEKNNDSGKNVGQNIDYRL